VASLVLAGDRSEGLPRSSVLKGIRDGGSRLGRGVQTCDHISADEEFTVGLIAGATHSQLSASQSQL
jgi:hypothetical protein